MINEIAAIKRQFEFIQMIITVRAQSVLIRQIFRFSEIQLQWDNKIYANLELNDNFRVDLALTISARFACTFGFYSLYQFDIQCVWNHMWSHVVRFPNGLLYNQM